MTIEQIDDAITHQLKQATHQLTKDSLKVISEFNLNDTAIRELSIDNHNYQGVYLIEIKNNNQSENFLQWSDDFVQRWNAKEYERKRTPRIIKSRLKNLRDRNELNDYIPLYVGKSRCIYKRIKEHLWMPLEKGTYALKLNGRKNLFGEVFRISAIQIKVINYNTIVPKIEEALRKDISPIIGRK